MASYTSMTMTNAGVLGLKAGGGVRMVGGVRAHRQGCQEEELRLTFLAGL